VKGVIFTEFLDFVEESFSDEMLETILSKTELSSQGSYTQVGLYDDAEMFALVETLSDQADLPVEDLLFKFGHHLFSRFAVLYPHFFSDPQNALTMLAEVESHIHSEVQKLYPDAYLPSVKFLKDSQNGTLIVYNSKRPLAKLCLGLIQGCIDYFGETLQVSTETISDDQTHARFRIESTNG